MKKCFFSGAVFLALLQTVTAQKVQPFKAGDRVVFAGNSITEAGLYESYIWLYYMTHFPKERITVFNAGVGGDVAGQIYTRLEGDILAKKPTVLAVTFGMNDSRYFEYRQAEKVPAVRKDAVETSFASFQKITQRLLELQNVKKILITSSPYDEKAVIEKNEVFHGKVETMEQIAKFQEAAAKKYNWALVDWMHPMTAINDREQKNKPTFTIIGPDRVHPGSAGHFVMAWLFLKAQGLAGQPVADVRINTKSKKVETAANCSVTGLSVNNNGLAFDYTPMSLPFPMDTVPRVWMNDQRQKDALALIPFVKEFDQELFTIKGLNGKRYTLNIDGEVIGSWSGAALAKGVNLAVLENTPQYKRAIEIMDLNNQRRELELKFRSYYWVHYDFLQEKGMLFNDTDAARDTVAKYGPVNGWLKMKTEDFETVRVPATRDALQKKMDGLVDRIYQLNQPVKHHVTITNN